MPRKTAVDADDADRAVAVASMRPRPDAAENNREREQAEAEGVASMRPRPDAAENSSGGVRGARNAPLLQ